MNGDTDDDPLEFILLTNPQFCAVATGSGVDFIFFPTSLCGVLVFDSVSRVLPRLSASPPPPPASVTLSTNTHHLSHTTLSHIISHIFFHTQLCHTSSFTHNFVIHNFVSAVTHHLSHIICHTSSHTSSFTHNFVTHHLSHTTLSYTTLSPLSHTIFHTHNFVTHHLTHLLSHTQLCHTSSFTNNFVTHHMSHIICHTSSHTSSFTHNFVAGVALGDIHLRFAWQAWHLWHWAGCAGALGPD